MAREETTSHIFRQASVAENTDLHAEIDKLQEKLAEVDKSLRQTQQQIAALEAQTKSLEKISDRHWQVWLALGGAILALLVSFLKK